MIKLLDQERFHLAISESIAPCVKGLIAECWDHDPDKRPSFEEIEKKLMVMGFQVAFGVNTTKLMAFVRRIEAAGMSS